ncbi:MAG: exodeoxyribonuclease VII large subunit [Gammaproteobacteria bacterium]|nr:exodeoxyribonuclease VII large subunit [Gammaproteobacteria bacterium]
MSTVVHDPRQPPEPDPAGRDIYSVTRLNREAKAVLEGSFPLLWVQGELSNLSRPASGHIYFSLKDEHSQVRCAMFRGRNRLLRFTLETGALVIARAQVSLYEGRGDFQLIVEQLEPAGIGALQRAFEELKKRLHSEGLFDEALKRPLPAYPRRIGVVTSPSGAALHDILTVLGRRYPRAGVIIYPTPVQGAGAAESIVDAIAAAGRRRECDVLMLARGGGSLEDLWPFNDERVARAIRACPIPVVTGVGHEIDFTIADFAADRRAPTPSAAAELVSPDQSELRQRVTTLDAKLRRAMVQLLQHLARVLDHLRKRVPDASRPLQYLAQRVDDLAARLAHSVRAQFAGRRSQVQHAGAALYQLDPRYQLREQIDLCRFLHAQLVQHMRHLLELARERLAGSRLALNAISPLATLERGYAIVTDEQKRVVVDAGKLRAGTLIETRFARGQAEARVLRIKK